MGSFCSLPRSVRRSASMPTPASVTSSRPDCASVASWPASCTTLSATTSRRSSSRPRPVASCRQPTPNVLRRSCRPSRRRPHARGNCTDLPPSRRGFTVGTFDGAGNLDS
jgi:hypothetical protein